MSKKYMDFAPRKAKKTMVGHGGTDFVGTSNRMNTASAMRTGTVRIATVRKSVNTERNTKPVTPSRGKVSRVVRKTTLATSPVAGVKSPIVRKQVVYSSAGKNAKQAVNFGVIEDFNGTPEGATVGSMSNKKVMTIPQSPFINQAKVEKRPLSKNVYKKKIEATKEPKTGPVTIIAKPEKEKHAGLVVTIIVTIILGAVAGTVAFLLLPK